MPSKANSTILRFRWKHMVVGALLASFLMSLMDAGKRDLEAQIEESRRRLDKLEKERAQEAKPAPKSGKQAAQDEELAEVRRQVDLLSRVREDVRLMPYYRGETLDTQAQVPAGYLRNPARDRSFHTLDMELKPISNIVIKIDYQWNRNRARTGLDQFNIAMGYNF